MGDPYRKIGRGYRAIIKVRVTPAQKVRRWRPRPSGAGAIWRIWFASLPT